MFPVIYPLSFQSFDYQLWLCGKPSSEWLHDDITQLANAGAKAWVCLMEKNELQEQDLGHLAKTCEKLELQYRHFPIPDRDVPIDNKLDQQHIDSILSHLDIGHVVFYIAGLVLGEQG